MTRGQVDPPLPAENKARRDMHTYELRPSKEQEWHWYTVVFLKFTPQASDPAIHFWRPHAASAGVNI
jgi:hypothetical protein